MTTTRAENRIPLFEARCLAEELKQELAPCCERIEIAGPIRRHQPTVGDIELVMMPKIVRQDQMDLFGEAVGSERVNCLDQELDRMLSIAEITKRLSVVGNPTWGERTKYGLWQGVKVDLFSVIHPSQWGVLFLIRTGSANYSHNFVIRRSQGGTLPAGMYFKNGALWDSYTRLETPEEIDVYRAVGREWVPPEQRS